MGEDLTEGGVVETLVKTSWPMVVAFFLHSTFNLADAFFVGKISAKALAAVSISFPLLFLIISLGSGIGVGVTSVVARFIGANAQKRADNASEHGLIAAFVLGLFLSLAGILVAPFLFDLMGVSESLKSMALDYINILLAFAPLTLLSFVGNSILRGEGDMLTPMKVMGSAAILNIILDPLLIFWVGLGVQGAALATALSRVYALIFILYHVHSGRAWVKLDFRNFSFDFEYIKRIFSVGIPSALSNISLSVGMFMLTVIVGFFGTDALAAFGVGFRLDSLAILPGLGVSIALVSIVGQNIGAGKVERARSFTLKAGVMSSAFMTLFGIVFYLFSSQIISIFNSEPLVVEYGASMLRIIPLSYMAMGVVFSITGAFLGSGRAFLALLINCSRSILFAVPAAYLLAVKFGFGLDGVWWGMVIGSFASVLVSLVLFRYARLEKKK
ncbi:MAG: MATE family efflux transporter [Candidatus Altiarchaeota archaeon]|nr:MATE family efflux transporter [Candidatus Altiarchaeota archaeon]